MIQTKTDLQKTRDLRDELVIRIARACEHLAATLRDCDYQFRLIDLAPCLECLNDDEATFNEISQANIVLGDAVNSYLDKVAHPAIKTRAPAAPMMRYDVMLDPVSAAFVKREVVEFTEGMKSEPIKEIVTP